MRPTFGHQIPVLAKTSLTASQLAALADHLRHIDPHIKGILPITDRVPPHEKTPSNPDTPVVKAGDRLVIPLTDSDAFARQQAFSRYRTAKGIPVPKASYSNVTQADDVKKPHSPIVIEPTPDIKSVWQKWGDFFHQVTQTVLPPTWQTRYYAKGNTQWALASATVAKVQNRLLDENTGLTIDWPNRALPYEWQGFMARPFTGHYPLHHNDRLTDNAFWPKTRPDARAINAIYPVSTYLDTQRLGPNALQVAYPYVHETFSPPTKDVTPPIVNITDQAVQYKPTGKWFFFKAQKPLPVIPLLRQLGQLVRHYKLNTLYMESISGLPLNSVAMAKGDKLKLFLGGRGSVNWPLIAEQIKADRAKLLPSMEKQGLHLYHTCDAAPDRFDVDNPMVYDPLKMRMPVIKANH